jgi:hypothetical protein
MSTDAAISILQELYGFVKRNLSKAQRCQPGKGGGEAGHSRYFRRSILRECDSWVET